MSKKSPYRPGALDHVIVFFGWLYLTVVMLFNRIEWRGKEHLLAALESDRPVYLAIWHGRLVIAAWVLRSYHPTTLVSQSRDGEIITRIVKKWGVKTLRGSSRRGGQEALRQIMRTFSDPSAFVAITMDGPKGPAHVVKPGSVKVAARNNAIFIPACGAATRKRTFEKSWDRLQIPKPFGKIIYQIGPPISYDPQMPAEELALLVGERTLELEKQVDALAAQLA